MLIVVVQCAASMAADPSLGLPFRPWKWVALDVSRPVVDGARKGPTHFLLGVRGVDSPRANSVRCRHGGVVRAGIVDDSCFPPAGREGFILRSVSRAAPLAFAGSDLLARGGEESSFSPEDILSEAARHHLTPAG